MAVLLSSEDRKQIFLFGSLACFFSPIPSLGLLPYFLLRVPHQTFNPLNISDKSEMLQGRTFLIRVWNDIKSCLTLENVLGAGIVLAITYAYFASNIHASDQTTNPFKFGNWVLYPIFILLEGFYLWFLFKERNKKNLYWYLAGIMFLITPFIKIGSAQDFCMRASIPTLFMLLFWSAQTLAEPRSPRRTFLIILLCIGAITPLYEINRSVYRTAEYFINPPTAAQKLAGGQMRIYSPQETEYDHPYTLTADSFKSLDNFDLSTITNFVAKENHSIFETYLEK